MKKILIIGKNSYLGKCFAQHLEKNAQGYAFDMISAKSDEWKNFDFSGYDSVVMFSGIVHQKENKKDEKLYFDVNSELTEKICKRASIGGVKQFVYMSTMSVYGKSCGIITAQTKEAPTTLYGRSKLLGEKNVLAFKSDAFNVAIVRPPMVYGKNCTGNYTRLSKLAKKLPVFPKVNNERSMIYSENLCEFLRLLCESQKSGIFCPQNIEYVSTVKLVELIAQKNNKSIKMTKLFNPLVHLALKFVPTVKKLFGTLKYEKSMSVFDIGEYNIFDFEESINLSEQR